MSLTPRHENRPQRARHAPLRRRAVVAAVLGIVAVPMVVGAALGQPTGTDTSVPQTTAGAGDPAGAAVAAFPAPLVAPVPAPAGPPDVRLSSFFATGDAQSPQVELRFAEAFTLPEGTYRASVLVGTPGGEMLRATLLSEGGATVGVLESSADGVTFTEVGEVEVSFQPSGVIVLPSGTTAVVTGADGSAAPPIAGLPVGPTASVVNQSLTVDYPEPPPLEVGGVAVVSAIDDVLIVPDAANDGVGADYIRVDHTNRTVILVDALDSFPPRDASGDRSWLVSEEPADSEGGWVRSFTFDLPAIAEALDFPPVGDATAIGVKRTLVLADGSVLNADAVLATLDWYAAALVSQDPQTPPTTVATTADTAESDETGTPWFLIGGALALVVAVLVAVVALVRRRRGDELDFGGSEGEGDLLAALQREDETGEPDPDVPRAPSDAVSAAEEPPAVEEPVVAEPVVAEPEPRSIDSLLFGSAAAAAASEAEAAPPVTDTPDLPVVPAASPPTGPVPLSPDDALASLEQDVRSFADRLAALGDGSEGDRSVEIGALGRDARGLAERLEHLGDVDEGSDGR